MDHYLNNNSWFYYPNIKGKDVLLNITFSSSNENNHIIQHLIKDYNGELDTCNLGLHNRMVTIKNKYILELLSKIFYNNEYSDLEIFQEYIYLYNHQSLYF
jgi:hypothetical protein